MNHRERSETSAHTLFVRLFVFWSFTNVQDIDMARAMETYASDLMPDGSKSYLSPKPPTE